MSRLPYFKWYPADAECDASFRAMDDADIGFYIRCLNHAWINGSIPADPIERARVLRTRVDVANRRWERVAKSFVNSTLDRDRLVNPRQELERESATSRCVKATESANRRYNRSANEVPTQCEGSAIQIQSQIQKEQTPLPTGVGGEKSTKEYSPAFLSWWGLYWNSKDKKNASKEYAKAGRHLMSTGMSREDAVTFLAVKVVEFRDTFSKTETWFADSKLYACRWLSNQRWEELDGSTRSKVVSSVSQEPPAPVKCKPSFGDGKLESESWDEYKERVKEAGRFL